jgi:hypothetical protein
MSWTVAASTAPRGGWERLGTTHLAEAPDYSNFAFSRRKRRTGSGTQSHRTDQGSSEHPDPQGPEDVIRCSVAIPPHRSGQFRHNFAGSYAASIMRPSQSHHTDQGSSEGHDHSAQAIDQDVVAIPPYRSGQFRDWGLINSIFYPIFGSSRNPTIQIRAVPRLTTVGHCIELDCTSQSHHTDQGSSESATISGAPPWSSRNPTIQIRAVPSGPLVFGSGLIIGNQLVTIPPYRSGQFRGSLPSTASSRQPRKSQSHHTDQGSSEVRGGVPESFRCTKSQSHHTDQGSSEGTPCRVLKAKGLDSLFFQPSRERCFSRPRTLISDLSSSRNPINDNTSAGFPTGVPNWRLGAGMPFVWHEV